MADPHPQAPSDPGDPGTSAPPDSTLGGYIRVHQRPPAFEGSDGQPYSVSIEVEKVPSLTSPWQGYLLFPRWAETGVGIVGHVETVTLSRGIDGESARAALEALPLVEVQALLDRAIQEKSDPDRSMPDPANPERAPAGAPPAEPHDVA